MQQLQIKDKGLGGLAPHPLIINWQAGITLTLRALIAERVRLEFERQSDEAAARLTASTLGAAERESKCLRPLVDAEMLRRLNPYTSKPDSSCAALVTVEAAIVHAIQAFGRNAFFVVVDGRQVENLDEEIPFRPTSEVTFLRLLPLVGG